jgi:hypothetical protein
MFSPTTLVIFLCGFALGFTATFLFIAWAEARRVKALETEAAHKALAKWRRDNPDVVQAWNEAANREPMELDQ